MQHIDDETLALLALGEDVLDDDARAHLSSCPECADAVARLARVVDAFDGADPADELVAPDAAVWSRVQAELGLTSAAAAPPVVAPAAVTDAPAAPTLPRDAAGTGAEAPDSTAGATGTAVVVPLASRRRRVWVPVAAAAAAALVVGGVGGILWERREVEPPETTVASATLDPLPDWQGASGDARVEERPDGRRQVVVTVDAPAPDGTYREVWLLAEDLSGLVSLGVLDGTEGRFDVPDGLDLAEFPVVDVSEEHFDGDPSHSGDSVVRGPLDV
ncbi:anti-sigma factor domain-containing protein [Cellulosimicrobium funkei]|uniref:anti-sigma factor n=1 Tax=Cellulosimicrobium funkei TaxID=264251 RepID=UPI003660A839